MNNKFSTSFSLVFSLVIVFLLENSSLSFAAEVVNSTVDKAVYDRPLTTFKNKSPQMSDNKSNAVQATVANQPMLSSKSIGYLPAAEFDGSNDFLTYDGTSLVGKNYTIFIVEKRSSNKANNCLIGTTNTAAPTLNAGLNICYKSNGSISFAQGSNEEIIGSETYGLMRSPVLHVFTQDKKKGKAYYRNGVMVFHDATNTEPLVSNDNAVIGKNGNNYFNGKVAEIIMFKKVLPENKLEANTDYLLVKWGISRAKTGTDCTPSSPGYLDIVDGQWSNNGNALNGGILSLSCINGKVIIGTADPLVCTNGVYSGKGGVCDVAPCLNPPSALTNGSWNYSLPVLNSQQITGSCNSGYVGSPTLTCNNGVWGSQIGSCTLPACAANNVDGIIDFTSLPGTLTNTNFNCNEYNVTGSITYTCIAGVLDVKANNCVGYYWKKITPNSLTAYPYSGSYSDMYGTSGYNFNSRPLCNAARVGLYSTTSSSANPNVNSSGGAYGPISCYCTNTSALTVFGGCGGTGGCNTGILQNAVWECRGNNNNLSCTSAPPSTSLTNGTWNYTAPIANGQDITGSCNSGYTSITTPKATCKDGYYTNQVGSCVQVCTNPTIVTPNSHWNDSNGQQVNYALNNSYLYFACNTGFTKVGTRVDLYCINGSWASGGYGSGYCEGAGCANPTGTGVSWNYSSSPRNTDGTIKDGTVLTSTCAGGYSQYVYPSTITCSNGTWVANGGCFKTACDLPAPALTNGTWSNPGGSYTYNSLYGTCNSGYVASGTLTNTCNSGTWTPNSQSCVKSTCDAAPSAIPNSTWNATTYPITNGTSVNGTCNSGYFGSLKATCNLGGTYSVIGSCNNTNVKCNAAPAAISNNTWNAPSGGYPVNSGTIITGTCASNYGGDPATPSVMCDNGSYVGLTGACYLKCTSFTVTDTSGRSFTFPATNVNSCGTSSKPANVSSNRINKCCLVNGAGKWYTNELANYTPSPNVAVVTVDAFFSLSSSSNNCSINYFPCP